MFARAKVFAFGGTSLQAPRAALRVCYGGPWRAGDSRKGHHAKQDNLGDGSGGVILRLQQLRVSLGVARTRSWRLRRGVRSEHLREWRR